MLQNFSSSKEDVWPASVGLARSLTVDLAAITSTCPEAAELGLAHAQKLLPLDAVLNNQYGE